MTPRRSAASMARSDGADDPDDLVGQVGGVKNLAATVGAVAFLAKGCVNLLTGSQPIFGRREAPDVVDEIPPLIRGRLVAKGGHCTFLIVGARDAFGDGQVEVQRRFAAHVVYVTEVSGIGHQPVAVSTMTLGTLIGIQ